MEIKHIADSGLGTARALQAATIDAARVTGVDEHLGSIEAGKIADMVIIDGDPLNDIYDLFNVVSVFRDGNQFNLDQLLKTP